MAGDFSTNAPIAATTLVFSAKESVLKLAAVLKSAVFSANGAAHTSPFGAAEGGPGHCE